MVVHHYSMSCGSCNHYSSWQLVASALRLLKPRASHVEASGAAYWAVRADDVNVAVCEWQLDEDAGQRADALRC